MTDKEKVERLQEILGKVKHELSVYPKCDVCVAVKLLRAKTLFDELYGEYERFLD